MPAVYALPGVKASGKLKLINISCLLGVISAVGTMVGLRMMKWNFLFRVGILNLVMVVVNNVLYHYKPWIGALPVVQKITFFDVFRMGVLDQCEVVFQGRE